MIERNVLSGQTMSSPPHWPYSAMEPRAELTKSEEKLKRAGRMNIVLGSGALNTAVVVVWAG